jgi:hypothetical protein
LLEQYDIGERPDTSRHRGDRPGHFTHGGRQSIHSEAHITPRMVGPSSTFCGNGFACSMISNQRGGMLLSCQCISLVDSSEGVPERGSLTTFVQLVARQ